MGNLFNSIPIKRPKRNSFNLSHEVKLTCNIGDLVPVDWREVIPGDTFEHKIEALVRFQALMAPIMHRVDVYFHHFFVPNRLLWNEFENFITGGEDGTATPLPPTIQFVTGYGQTAEKAMLTASTLREGTLCDFMGLPTIPSDVVHAHPDGNTSPNYLNNYWSKSFKVSALPFRAYQLIYNEWYRDQNLQDKVDIPLTSGSENNVNLSNMTVNPLLQMRKRNWHKDYFTSALPFVQRGPEVRLPIQGTAGLIFDNYDAVNDAYLPTVIRDEQGNLINENGDLVSNRGILRQNYGTNYNSQMDANVDVSQTHKVDLSQATSSTINELRRTIKVQEWFERNARGGARYIEQILSHFGVMGKDSRLQRPQYLGGSKMPVTISEVVQQSATGSGDTPQGNLAGRALSITYDNGYKRFFDEHGIVMTIMSIMPKANYQQGLPRKFQRRDKFDYYFPEFAHLGEQPIFQSEIFYDFKRTLESQQDSQSDETAVPFGYTPRYAEYKTELNRVHGQFKSSLAFWHMGRIFGNTPGLNSEFVQVDGTRDDLNRVFATEGITDDYGREIDKVEVQLYHQIKAKRPMPKYGVPMI